VRAFIDTSSLFKKYVEESGWEELDETLNQVSEIAISPLAWVEFNSAVSRRLREKKLTSEYASSLLSEAKRDFQSYSRVIWNETLETVAAEMTYRYSLSTLDAVQLASGLLSKADLFVTSDRRLFEEARKTVRGARFIG